MSSTVQTDMRPWWKPGKSKKERGEKKENKQKRDKRSRSVLGGTTASVMKRMGRVETTDIPSGRHVPESFENDQPDPGKALPGEFVALPPLSQSSWLSGSADYLGQRVHDRQDEIASARGRTRPQVPDGYLASGTGSRSSPPSSATTYTHWTSENNPMRAQELPTNSHTHTRPPDASELSQSSTTSSAPREIESQPKFELPTSNVEPPPETSMTSNGSEFHEHIEKAQEVENVREHISQQPQGQNDSSDGPDLAPARPPTASDRSRELDERLRGFLGEYDVQKKQPGLSWLETLFVWVNNELSDKQKVLEDLEECKAILVERRNDVELMERELDSLSSSLEEVNHLNISLRDQNTTLQLREELKVDRSKLQKHSGTYRRLLKDNNELKDENNRLCRELDDLDAHNHDLKSRIGNLKQHITHLEALAQDREREWQQELKRVEHNHGIQVKARVDENQSLRTKHEQEKLDLQAEHHGILINRTDEHEREKAELEKRHATEKTALEKRHTTEFRASRIELNTYKRQLAMYNSSGSYAAIPDQEFSTSFRRLAQRISNLVALVPQPPNLLVAGDELLDPSRYLARHMDQVNRAWPKFLRSACWCVLIEGFFSIPLGFGALGKIGEGMEMLHQLRMLFVKGEAGDSDQESAPFPSDKELNVWRAELFGAILREATGSPASSARNFASLFHANVSRVSASLISTLEQLSASSLDARALSQVQPVVHGLGTLALQMGAQRAQVLLESVDHGAWIKPDEKFMDESDGTGTRVQVDIMTLPCMRRVGDGRDNIGVQQVVVKGSMVGLDGERAQ